MGFLNDLLTGSASGLVDSLGTAIDKCVTSDEERQSLKNELKIAVDNHEARMLELAIKKEETILSDIDSARVNQSRVQEAEHAGWLAKNIQPFLALVICCLGFGVFGKVLFGTSASINEHGIVMMVLGAIVSYIGQILSFFFGASTDTSDAKKAITRKKLLK